MRARILTALALVSTLSAGEIESAHYRLETPEAGREAEESSRLLEAAFGALTKHFKKKPKGKLVVRAGEATAYDPESEVATYAPQATRYATRVQLLRAAATQFQLLARARNEFPVAGWYRDGLPEHLASHHWDGAKLALGVLPLVASPDHAAAALAAARADGFSLAKLVDGGTEDLSLAWALVRFLHTQEPKGFDKLAKKLDGGNEPDRLFRKMIGDPDAMQPRFLEWLAKEQLPWAAVGGDWQGLDPERVRGAGEKRCGCYLKGPVRNLTFTLEKPDTKKWMAGALIHWTSDDDWSVALLDWGGFIRIERWTGQRWQVLERGAGPQPDDDGKFRFQVFRRKGQTSMMVGKMFGYGPWDLPGDSLGLAVEGCDVTFTEVAWK